jgi:hypothetical protein
MANYATPDPADDQRHLAPLDICTGTRSRSAASVRPRGEELLIATFDLDALRAYRAYEAGGDAYRKPGSYGARWTTHRCRCRPG